MAESQQESLHFLDYWGVVRSRKEIVIAVSLLVIVTGILITYSLPRVFMSSSVIAVKEERPDVQVFGPEAMRYDPLFLRTQFEIIQSSPVIEDVVRQLDLVRKLSAAMGYTDLPPLEQFKRTVAIVSGSLKVQQFRDTNLIEIQIYLSEPQGKAHEEAAHIANMVAEVYREQNMSRSREATQKALGSLYDSLQEQEKRVDAAETAVEVIRKKYNIAIVAPEAKSGGARTALEQITLQQLEANRVRVMMDMEGRKATYEKFMSLDTKTRLQAAPYLARDAALAQLIADRRTAEVEMKRLTEAGLGNRHPDVLRMQAVVTALKSKISEALAGLEVGLLAGLEAEKAKLQALNDELDKLRASAIEAEGAGYREFDSAVEELVHARKIRDALEMRHLQEQIELRIPRTTVEMIAEAKPANPAAPVSPRLMLNLILSIVVGLGASVGLAFFIEYLDTSVKTIDDVERGMEMPVLGVVPQKVKPLTEEVRGVPYAEAYRVLRANIQFSQKFKAGKTICVTSGSVGEGKSLTLFNLACTCADMGDKILLVDSDLHRPRQHRMVKVSNQIGLCNVIIGEVPLEEAIVPTAHPNMSFLPSGKLTSGVHGLLDTTRMRDLIKELAQQYDLVLFDGPPIIGVSDASLLVREVDAVLLVIQHRKYPRSVSSRARDLIDNIGGNLLGVVLNNINVWRDYSYYYQQYYYSPSKKRGDEDQEPKA